MVDNICSPISNQAIDLAKFKYPHLTDLPLADSGNGNENLEVEIMVGADYLWNFMLDHVHTYIHTHIHTYIHTYVHTYIHTYIFLIIQVKSKAAVQLMWTCFTKTKI